MIRWLIDFRFAVHYRLTSDIARGLKSAPIAEVGAGSICSCPR
jgi:hypothetical protein